MNITCPKCRFRHPAERSCADAKELADQAALIRAFREALQAAMEFLPATRSEGDQYGFWEVKSGTALLAAREKVLSALQL